METLTVEQITGLQKQYGYTTMQKLIDSGQAWLREGFTGRQAMAALEAGSCMLPEEKHTDFYGTTVPGRNDLKPGSKGTLQNSQEFWQKVIDGEIIMNEDVEEEIA